MIEIEKIADQLVNLTVKDINELSNILKKKHGIEANYIPNQLNNNTNLVEEVKEEEKSSYNVILKSAGSTKLKVIKAIKDILGKSLTESKQIADSAPKAILKQNISKKEAENIKKQFEEYGAEIELT